MTTTLNIRIDEKTKELARVKFKKAGLSLSSGIKCYLCEVAKSKASPFAVRTVNGFTPEYEAKILKEIKYAENMVKGILL